MKWQFREAYMWSKYKDDVYQCIIVCHRLCFGVGIDAFVYRTNWWAQELVVLVLYSIHHRTFRWYMESDFKTFLYFGQLGIISNKRVIESYLVWYRHVVLDVRCLWSLAIQYGHFWSLLSSMMAGVTGIGLGMVYRVGGNTGGLDPIALIVENTMDFIH